MAKRILLLLFTTLLVPSLYAQDNDQCGLYLAESSTSTADEPKWGLYAGKALNPREPIGFGDVAINTHHMEANSISEDFDDEYLSHIVEYFENFIWV